MEVIHKIETDGSITLTLKFNPTGSFLEQEEQIAEVVTEAGRLASRLVMGRYDTKGEAIIVENKKYTSKGKKKKHIKHRGEQ